MPQATAKSTSDDIAAELGVEELEEELEKDMQSMNIDDGLVST